MSWFGRDKKAKLERIDRALDETLEQVAAQESRVNAVVSYLERRKLMNGFGQDFEWTLANPRRAGG